MWWVMHNRRAEARFRELHRDHVPALLAYAVRRVPSPDQAADVVADTMLVAWRRLDSVPAGDAARLWLFAVARNTIANHARGIARRRRLADRLRHQLVAALPATDTDASAVSIDLHRALAALDPIDRELVQLTVWEGCTPGEAAAVTGILPATARTRLFRARSTLRAALADHCVAARTASESGDPT